MTVIDDLWTAYKACLMLGSLITTIRKHLPPSEKELKPVKPARKFTLEGNQWPRWTHRTIG